MAKWQYHYHIMHVQTSLHKLLLICAIYLCGFPILDNESGESGRARLGQAGQLGAAAALALPLSQHHTSHHTSHLTRHTLKPLTRETRHVSPPTAGCHMAVLVLLLQRTGGCSCRASLCSAAVLQCRGRTGEQPAPGRDNKLTNYTGIMTTRRIGI